MPLDTGDGYPGGPPQDTLSFDGTAMQTFSATVETIVTTERHHLGEDACRRSTLRWLSFTHTSYDPRQGRGSTPPPTYLLYPCLGISCGSNFSLKEYNLVHPR